jgi:mannitol-1-/sugar-/sorbitol-6-/2-deoxyglucose-6-phosphatase
MIDAVIFDLDGLLIDSEPLWRRAEIEVFARAGLVLTDAQCAETTGLRLDEVVRLRMQQHRAWHTLSEADAIEAIHARVVELLRAEGVAKEGAREAVRYVASKGVRVALASSSAMRVIDAALARLGLASSFEVVRSAEHEPYGKPHPGVYLTTAQALGVAPTACVAIEDSLNGLIAAKAARMRCVAVPEHDDARFALADLTLRSLTALDDVAWQRVTG